MTEGWTPAFRTPRSNLTRALRSPAFAHSRERADSILGDPLALRQLADAADLLNHISPPLSTVSDRLAAALAFLRARADDLETEGTVTTPPSTEAKERLVVAAVHYLVTPVDLVPDFRAGGYVDDVLVLSWVFGAAMHELEPFLEQEGPDPDAGLDPDMHDGPEQQA